VRHAIEALAGRLFSHRLPEQLGERSFLVSRIRLALP
jgi:hypothetical protein